MKDNLEIAKRILTDGAKILMTASSFEPAKQVAEDPEPYLLFLQTLQKWNHTYNLTHITDLKDMVIQHILDSLSIAPYLTKTRYLDLGTGAGLPGFVLAIFFPDKQFVLMDSNSKKTAFLTQAKALLKLSNVEILTARAEDYQPQELFDGVMSRAVGNLELLWQLGAPLLKADGDILAMKGQLPQDEIKNLAKTMKVSIYPLKVPFLEAARHLVILHSDKSIA